MGNQISEILKKRLGGENLSKLARDLGIPKTLLHEWVEAKRLPSMKNLAHIKALSNHLGLSLEQLLIGEENKVISSISFEDDGRKYIIKIERQK